MSTFERWTLLISAVAVLMNVALFVGFGLQLRLLRDQRDHSATTMLDHKLRHLQSTVDFVTKFLDARDELRSVGLPPLRRSALSPFLANPLNTEDSSTGLAVAYLNDCELFATAVNLGLHDLGVVNTLVGPDIVRTQQLYRPFIEARRTETQSPTLWEEVEALAATVVAYRAQRGLPEADVPD